MQHTEVNPPAAAAAVPVGNGLFVILPGLAQVYMDVDEARSDNHSAGIEFFICNFGMEFGGAISATRPSRSSTSIAMSMLAAGSITRPPLINNDPELDLDFVCAMSYLALPNAFAKIAIRVGTPLRTSSTITDCGQSATSQVNSIPRITGPGCMTIASFFASRTRAAFI